MASKTKGSKVGGASSVSVRLGALAKNRELAMALAVALADDGDCEGARLALLARVGDVGLERLGSFLDALDSLGKEVVRSEIRGSPRSGAPGQGWLKLADSFAMDASRAVELACGGPETDPEARSAAFDVAKRLLSFGGRVSDAREPLVAALLGGCGGKDLAWMCCHWAFGAAQLGAGEEALELVRCMDALGASVYCARESGAALARSGLLALPGSDKNLKAMLWAMAAKLPAEGWEAFREGCPATAWSSLEGQRWSLDNKLAGERELSLVSLALMHVNHGAGKLLCEKAGCDAMEAVVLSRRWIESLGLMANEDYALKSASWNAVAESWAMAAESAPGRGGPNAGRRI